MKKLDGRIEKVDRNKITKNNILDIYEIERDTWSYFMGEYVKCKNCNVTFSKKDIYGDIDNYENKSVNELEKEFGRHNVKCNCCGSDTEDIRGEELINILELRIFSSKEGFVNFYKSSIDEILGFSYGFIDSPEKTYEKEFSYHFNENLLKEFDKKFGNEDLLTLSGVCIKQKANNISAIFELVKNFYCSIDSKYNNITGVGEAILDTPSYKVYKKMLSDSFNINNSNINYLLDKQSGIKTDILYGSNSVERYKKIKDMNLNKFLKYTKTLSQKIIYM